MWLKIRQFISSSSAKRLSLFILIVVFIGAFTPWFTNFIGKKQFENNRFSESHQFFSVASVIAWYNKPTVLKNKADASLKKTSYETAIKEYEKALEKAPPSLICPIRFNWSMTYFLYGESVRNDDPTKATRLYLEALRVLTVKQCFESDQYKDKFKDFEQQIKQQLDKIEKDKNQSKTNKNTTSEVNLDKILNNSDEQVKQQLDYLQQKSSSEASKLNDSDNSFRFVY